MNRHERRAAASNSRAKGLPTQAGGVAEAINNGIAAINAGKYQEAEQLFRQMLKADPNMAEAKHQLGTVLARTGRADEGIRYLREATAARPKEALYWSNLAAACYIAHDSEGAIEASRHAVALQPDYGLAWDNLASSLMDRGDFAEAIPAFDKAIALGAGDLESMKRLSSCYFGIEDYANAIRVMRDVLARQGDDVEILASLGAALLETKDFDAAKDALAKAAALNADHFPTAYHYSRALRLTGDAVSGLRWLRRATSADPRNPIAWRDLAEALFDAGETNDAKVAIERAVSLAPNAPSVRQVADRIIGPIAVSETPAGLNFGDIGSFAPLNLTPGAADKAKTPEAGQGVVDLSVLKIGS